MTVIGDVMSVMTIGFWRQTEMTTVEVVVIQWMIVALVVE
jgi:hypothetical protein